MAHYDLKTGLDLLHAALLDAGEAASITGDYGDDAKRAVQDAYWSVLTYARWPWALAQYPGVIQVQAAQRVTVSSTSSNSMTLSANLSPTAAGWKIYIESNQAAYRIVGHTSGTASLVLDVPYIETDNTGPAIIYKDEYGLSPDLMKIWDPLWIRDAYNQKIVMLDKPLFEERYGRGAWGFGAGVIEAACEVAPEPSTTAVGTINRRIRLAPWSETAANLEYDYTILHVLDFSGVVATDTPRIPREHRSVVSKLAASLLLVGKDDGKAQDYAAMGAGKLQTMMDQYLPSQSGRLYVHPRHAATLGMT